MRRKRRGLAIAIVVILLAGGAFIAVKATQGPSLTPAQIAAQERAARIRALIKTEKSDVHTAAASLSVVLPTKYNTAAPQTPATLFTKPLGSKQVIGFVPYYTLGELTPTDYASASELCYFGLQINANGTLQSPAQFVGLSTSAFSDFVETAHQSQDQVLLTISAFSKSVIDGISRNPQKTAALLNAEISPLITTYGLQGVDLDIEGRWGSDRKGFATFVRTFSTAFRADDASRIIVLDSFPQSAGTPDSFYDFKALTPEINDYFIMAYAMYSDINASANSPAYAPSLNLSDVQTLIQYTKVVPRSKLILGIPFYGFDFETESSRDGAFTSTPDPEAVTYSAVAGVGRKALWDPVSETPYDAFREGLQWHETWFDDPLSIALKVALAKEFRIAGTGVWALGMEGGDTQMLAALDGESPPKKLALAS